MPPVLYLLELLDLPQQSNMYYLSFINILTQNTTFETECGEIKKFNVLRYKKKEEEVALQCSGTAADAVAVVCAVTSQQLKKKKGLVSL